MLDLLATLSATAAPIAFTALRAATGSFFVLSGYHKLFNKARHASLTGTLKADGIPAVWAMQWFVPAVEFLGGLGVTTGTLTPLAALGLLAICTVATCTDGLGRIAAWSPIDRADYVDDVLYLPEVIYAAILAYIVAHGAGPWSVDAIAIALVR